VGALNAARCDHWRGLLAMRVVGQLDPEDRTALEAHLEGCAECRAEADDLESLTKALPLADPAHLTAQSSPPAGLGDAVLRRVQQAEWDEMAAQRRTRRHRRIRWVGTGAGVGAVAAAAIALALFVGGSPKPSAGRTLALHGPPGVQASVVLTAVKWGSEVELQESGQPAGQVMWVIMGNGYDSSPWMGGSYRTTGSGTVHVRFSCALKPDEITKVWVDNTHLQTVLTTGYD